MRRRRNGNEGEKPTLVAGFVSYCTSCTLVDCRQYSGLPKYNNKTSAIACPTATRIDIWCVRVVAMFSVACLRLLLRSVVNLSHFSQPRHVQVILVLSLPCPVVLTRFFLQLSALGHTFMICFLLYCLFFLDVCSFPDHGMHPCAPF